MEMNTKSNQGVFPVVNNQSGANKDLSQQVVNTLADAILKAVKTTADKTEKRLQKVENGKVQNDNLNNNAGCLIGDTKTIKPAKVASAIKAGQNVLISHQTPEFGNVLFSFFVILESGNAILSSDVAEINNELGACQLWGDLILNEWVFNVYTLAEKSEIPANPEDIGALGSTDRAYDSLRLGGKAPEYYIQPRNLLDNSDFTNPVNQRGQESYSGASQYTIDRWRTWTKEAAITMVDGGISVTNEALFQYHPLSVLKAENLYTGVVGYADGSVYCAAFAGGEGGGENHLPFKAGYDGGKAFFRINPSEKTVAYAALYEGAYTAETLPPYVPKGYAAELAECQRYYENSWFGLSKNEPLQTISLAWAANSCEGEFRFSTEKRAVPTMTAYPSGGRNAVCVYVNGYQPVSSTTWLMRSGLKGAWLRATMGSAMLTIGYAYGLHAHWEASADL